MLFKSLLVTYAPQERPLTYQPPSLKSVKEQRANMAQTHAQMVEALAAAVGHDKAVALGRESLFASRSSTWKQTRSKLGVGESQSDLIKASKILYRILGIDFHIEWLRPNQRRRRHRALCPIRTILQVDL